MELNNLYTFEFTITKIRRFFAEMPRVSALSIKCCTFLYCIVVLYSIVDRDKLWPFA